MNKAQQQYIDKLHKKYTKFISNIEWHIDNNKPTGEALSHCTAEMEVYKQVLSDIEPLITKP